MRAERVHSFLEPSGRPSLAPVIFVKLLLVGHVKSITSGRKLLELTSLHLGSRIFMGYELHPT
ncbi:transposase [Hymenobacter glacieicola]|uniref:transposase n=1 Tax=Hymenobacter glacieicola TaxID=1562124 RepID=UPI0035714243